MSLGERIKYERELRNLTLFDVASDCGISESQLYKIENYKVNIKTPTLLKLAAYYGNDIIGSHDSIIDNNMILVLNLINKDIRDRDIYIIKKSLEIITYINNKSTNIVISGIAKQYFYLVNGLICLNENNYLSARELFLNGIKSFDPFINTTSFDNIGSSSIQLKLLMAYAITYRAEQNYEKCISLLNKVVSNGDNTDPVYKKAIYNIANIYSLIGKYNESNNVLNNYLRFQHLNININYENIIYFKMATVLYRIGHNDYKKYALKCLYSSFLSKDINSGLIFLNVFNNLFDTTIMTKESFLSL